ncbi:serine threonine-protein kinase [Ceraceosorus bombacis]|uniref:Serine threonine-protein kinase n=1 Tax=Ceraceosorus bombacis TaxID=401625 RepID=A0A0P1BRG5_9BASI|nr:serine threonine-protein kinase [Ceraceosorus bombacis]
MMLGIEREIVIMKLIEHPNLIGLWDVYETSKELYLVMEYVAGGELFDHLVAKGRLKPDEARSYFRQIIFGLDFCHQHKICHRDLKPENLLLDATKQIVKVADFGMAALGSGPSGPVSLEKMLETSCGSPHYASPEIVSGKAYRGDASDIWSCGIILFALLCGRLPFDDPNIQVLLSKVKRGRFEMPAFLEPGAKDLISRMLEIQPERRLRMDQIMRHPWFTNGGRESSYNPVQPLLGRDETEANAAAQHGSRPVSPVRGAQPSSAQNDRLSAAHPQYAHGSAPSSPAKSFVSTLGRQANASPTPSRANSIDSRRFPAGPRTGGRSPDRNALDTGRKPLPSPTRASGEEDAHRTPVKGVTLSRPNTSPSRPDDRTPSRANTVRTPELTPKPLARTSTSPSKASTAGRPASIVRGGSSRGEANGQSIWEDITEQLANLGSSDTAQARPNVSRQNSKSSRSRANSGIGARPMAIPTGEDDHQNQFEDADEDSDDAGDHGSVQSGSESSGYPYTPTSPMPPTFPSPAVNTAPLSVVDKEHRASTRAVPKPAAPTGSRPNSIFHFKNDSTPAVERQPTLGRRRSLLGVRRKSSSTADQTQTAAYEAQSARSSVAYERLQDAGAARQAALAAGSAGARGPTRLQQQKNAGLGLDLATLNKNVQNPLAANASVPGTPASVASSSGGAPNSPKQSWFTSLFQWKTVHHTLYSVENFSVTHNEVKRILQTCPGAKVYVEDSENANVLKCSLPEIRDGGGSISASKPLRFRVEFAAMSLSHTATNMGASPALSVGSNGSRFGAASPALSNHSGKSGASAQRENVMYSTSCHMVHEKGSATAFRSLCEQLRRQWTLGGPSTPASPAPGATGFGLGVSMTGR